MTTFTDEVRDAHSGFSRFNSRRAAAAHLISMDTSWLDEETGSVTEWDLWCGRLGRNLLVEDGRGFVECHRYPSVTEAAFAFALLEQEYVNFYEAEEA